MSYLHWIALFLLITVNSKIEGTELSDIANASDALIDIVLSDEFDNLFAHGKTKVSGLKILRYVEKNSNLHGMHFETLFTRIVGAESVEELERKEFSWNDATDVINAIIKLADNISVNESRKPNSKYKKEDERITEAKKLRKDKRKRSTNKQEL